MHWVTRKKHSTYKVEANVPLMYSSSKYLIPLVIQILKADSCGGVGEWFWSVGAEGATVDPKGISTVGLFLPEKSSTWDLSGSVGITKIKSFSVQPRLFLLNFCFPK